MWSLMPFLFLFLMTISQFSSFAQMQNNHQKMIQRQNQEALRKMGVEPIRTPAYNEQQRKLGPKKYYYRGKEISYEQAIHLQEVLRDIAEEDKKH